MPGADAPSGDRRRVSVTVTGVVQAVGFRPFVYRTATDLGLAGSVRNLGDAGVSIDLEGDPGDVETFLAALREDPPPLATVDSVEVTERDPKGERGVGDAGDRFVIESSESADRGSGSIPPDTGVCERCLADVRDPDSRYHGYWATACVDCGPRFTVVRSLPYDRERTAMDAYPLCGDCLESHEDPADRRYHAQTTACPACGPRLRLVTAAGETLASGRDAIGAAAERIADGRIVGVKGTGGTHLACEATDTAAVSRLRERLGRPAKPFALMAPDVGTVRGFARVGDRERGALTGIRRPIVALEKRDRAWLDVVSPGLHTVGVMLPYAGLHHLLFDDRDPGPLVMTSANPPGVPMATTSEGLLGVGAIDAALVHDREIVARCDDSVLRVVDGVPTFLRRSRGWVPSALPGESGPPVLAMGGEFDATVAVTRGGEVIPGQHVGDVDGPEALAAHREATDHLLELFGVDPDVVACDAHPEFLTTAEAERRPGDVERVQHHHAHAVSLLGEHERDRGVVITVDGTGYGPDGTVWGGEVLVAGREGFERVGGLAPFGLPGGEQAVRYPARILASLLGDSLPAADVDGLLAERGVREAGTTRGDAAQVRRQVAAGVNTPTTTSAGRYLDAVASLLGVCTTRGYEGQPAMELEAAAAGGGSLDWDVPYATVDGRRCVDVAAVVRRIAEGRTAVPTADLAATAQDVLARGLASLALEAAARRDLPVGLSGGVAVNEAIVETVAGTVAPTGRSLLTHDRVPPGDGGLAYGQALVALARRQT